MVVIVTSYVVFGAALPSVLCSVDTAVIVDDNSQAVCRTDGESHSLQLSHFLQSIHALIVCVPDDKLTAVLN